MLSENIRYLRIKNNLTQLELAKKLNKADSTVRMWELGKSEPNIKTLLMISEIFDISLDDLIKKNKEEKK